MLLSRRSGELCPLEWIHHRFLLNGNNTAINDDDEHLEAGKAHHVRMHIWKYTGDFFAMSSDRPPLKRMAPYSHLGKREHELILDYCDVHINDSVNHPALQNTSILYALYFSIKCEFDVERFTN